MCMHTTITNRKAEQILDIVPLHEGNLIMQVLLGYGMHCQEITQFHLPPMQTIPGSAGTHLLPKRKRRLSWPR